VAWATASADWIDAGAPGINGAAVPADGLVLAVGLRQIIAFLSDYAFSVPGHAARRVAALLGCMLSFALRAFGKGCCAAAGSAPGGSTALSIILFHDDAGRLLPVGMSADQSGAAFPHSPHFLRDAAGLSAADAGICLVGSGVYTPS
jgi:hypothetical protein